LVIFISCISSAIDLVIAVMLVFSFFGSQLKTLAVRIAGRDVFCPSQQTAEKFEAFTFFWNRCESLRAMPCLSDGLTGTVSKL